MRLAMSGGSGENLELAVHVGVTDVVGGNSLSTDEGYYTVEELVCLRRRVEEAGLTLSVVGGLPEHLMYKWKLGLPGRDEQIHNWCTMLRNAGEASISSICHFFSLCSSYWDYGLRTDRSSPVRGGSKLTSFDYEEVKTPPASTGIPPCRSHVPCR